MREAAIKKKSFFYPLPKEKGQ